MALSLTEAAESSLKCRQSDISFGERIENYNARRHTYDQGAVLLNYRGPDLVAEYLEKFASHGHVTQDSLILDLGAGSGLVGQVLKSKLGLQHIDGLDASPGLLMSARDKAVYERLYLCEAGDGRTLPFLDDTYDAAVMCGVFVEGHIKLDVFHELMRVVKKGGLIVNVMRKLNIEKAPEYKNLPELFKQWEDEGLWECLEEAVPDTIYMEGDLPLIHVYKVGSGIREIKT